MDFQDFNDDEELAALEKASADQKNMKGYLGALGAVADNFQSIPGSHELLWGGKGRAPTASKALGAVTAQMEDPLERKQKAFEYLKSKRAEKAALDADSPASPEMVSFYEGVVPSMKGKFSGMTAAQLEKVSPVLMAKFRAEGDERIAKVAAGQRNQDRADAKAEKAALDQKERTTQFGVARTPDDAKKLKDAAELKASFDSKLQEMIELRKKHGGEVMNREAVNRGKSLANDLLLAYKDLSKLGVMSKTDENILRSIIPADPLQFNSPLAAVQGQDPTLNQMEKFKGDAERDFQERLKNRLENYAGAPAEKTVVKQERNKKTGQVRITYSDGSQEIKSTAGL